MILTYITMFSVGEGSEALIIDHLDVEESKELIVWDSPAQYHSARKWEPENIDGGIYSYGLLAGTAALPDDLINNQIVSFLAPSSAHAILKVLNSVVEAMRSVEWPDSLYIEE